MNLYFFQPFFYVGYHIMHDRMVPPFNRIQTKGDVAEYLIRAIFGFTNWTDLSEVFKHTYGKVFWLAYYTFIVLISINGMISMMEEVDYQVSL